MHLSSFFSIRITTDNHIITCSMSFIDISISAEVIESVEKKLMINSTWL